jgi:hypothetical protein
VLAPILLEAMERHGHLPLAPEVRSGLLQMSAATIFRLVFVVVITRSVYHDRTALFQLRPRSHFPGPVHYV